MTAEQEREAIRREAFEEAAKLCELYGEINMEICGDNILMDPLLRGGQFTEANVKLSDNCSMHSTIHSSKYHASIELAAQIRAHLSQEPKP